MNVYSIGFWGAPNLGDELICKAVNDIVVDTVLSRSNIHYTLTNNSASSEEYHRLQQNTHVHGFFPTPEYFAGIRSHINAILKSDLITVGGGGLISDKYTWQAIPRYLVDLLLCIVLNKRICFVGIGVLELKRSIYKYLVKFVLKNSSGIYLRDEESLRNLEVNASMSFGDKVIIGPDLSHYVQFETKGIIKDYAVVNLRENPALNDISLRRVFNSIDCEKIVLLCAEPSDYGYYNKIISVYEGNKKFEIINPKNIYDAVKIIDESKYIFTERLHVTAIAAELGKKSFILAYEGKVRSYIENSYSSYSMVDLKRFNLGVIDINYQTPIKKERVKSELIKKVKSCFSRVIQKEVKITYFSRFISLILYILIFVLGGLYACAIILKRAVFGRGRFRFFGVDFG